MKSLYLKNILTVKCRFKGTFYRHTGFPLMGSKWHPLWIYILLDTAIHLCYAVNGFIYRYITQRAISFANVCTNYCKPTSVVICSTVLESSKAEVTNVVPASTRSSASTM